MRVQYPLEHIHAERWKLGVFIKHLLKATISSFEGILSVGSE